ncbi:hypothetical protein NEIFL0001_0713 [Neisseria flavescens SK114]|nr:hypothetical protein NEIFL0001_0713 [Neisseria flavescens SK114]
MINHFVKPSKRPSETFSDGLFKRLPIWLWNNIVLRPIFKRKECFSISL